MGCKHAAGFGSDWGCDDDDDGGDGDDDDDDDFLIVATNRVRGASVSIINFHYC